MQRRLLLILAALIALSALPAAAPAAAQGGGPSLVTEFEVPDVPKVKFPSIAARDGVVHLGATARETDALYWNKSEAATSFGAPFRVGLAEGQGDYSSASIFIGPDNTIYYAYGSIEERRIKLKLRAPNGTWGPERIVAQGEPFPVFARVAFAQGRTFVIWQDISRPVAAKISADAFASSAPKVNISSKFTFSAPPAIAVGPSGQVAAVWNSIDYEIFVGVWNGSSFVEERVTQTGFSNPSISIGPDGTLHTAFRGIGGDSTPFGAYTATRQANGGWPVETLASGAVEGAVQVVVDKDNTRHFSWQARPSGSPQIFYTFQPPGQQRAAAVGSSAGAQFNPSLAVGNSDTGLAHVAAERFIPVGDSEESRLRYYQFRGIAVTPIGATPRIENNAEVIRDKDTVSVNFIDLTGDPTEILWKWGGPPTDADNDSGGWKPFSNPMTIPLKADLPDNCTPVTLYTRVRNATVAQSTARDDSVKIDGAIDALLAASNPYSQSKSPGFSGVADLGSEGASDGDPGYTRVPVFYLELRNQSDCSGIKDVATGVSSTSLQPPYEVQDGTYANIVPFPRLPADGENTVLMRVSDSAGNTRDYNQTFTYDTRPPVLSSSGQGALTLGATPSTLLVDLEFSNIQVTDDHYPAPGFWGVWVANSRSPVADPLSSSSLVWLPLQTSGASSSFTVPSWSLAGGLPADQVTTGTYYVYVRFLDGAGNPTAGYLTAQTNLTAVTLPALYLPLTIR